MFPNPQDALPLPPRPSLERYRKLAKDLVKACKSAGEARPEADEADTFSTWAEEWAEAWIGALVRLSGIALEEQLPVRVGRWIDQVAEFARRQLKDSATHARDCALSDAQFVIARSHGFESWPKFVRALEALERAGSSDAKFEAAADAIVSGDIATLKRLLTEAPELIHARSMREHGASLLHYVAANGVEGYRQKTPKNVVEIAELLLRTGAEANTAANVYGGGCTTLGLVATSGHPEHAGVQQELLRLLLEHGAAIDGSLVRACLHNGRGQAAEFLAGVLIDRGERLGLVEAAGAGKLELVEGLVVEDDEVWISTSPGELRDGFLFGCQFGRDEVVEFLIAAGMPVGVPDGRGQTGLHHAVIGGQVETVKLLLRHNPPLEAVNAYGGTPLGQALWSAAHGGDAEASIAILEALTAAGAKLPERHVPVNPKIDTWLEEHGSHAEPSWYWHGEKPRGKRRENSSN